MRQRAKNTGVFDLTRRLSRSTVVLLVAACGCASSPVAPRRPVVSPSSPALAGGAGAEARLPRAFRGGIDPTNTSLGPRRAKVRIEWFSDYECPYCARAHKMMVRLARQFPQQLRIRHRDYPLDMQCNPRITRPFHGRACAAAVHTRCAAAQGKFWPYTELMTKSYRALDDATLQAHASALHLDIGRFRRCLQGKAARAAVDADIELGMRLGVRGTPSYYIGGKQVREYTLSGWIRRVRKLLGKTKP